MKVLEGTSKRKQNRCCLGDLLHISNIIKHRLHVWSGQHSANRRMVTSRSTTWRTADNTFLHFFVVQSPSHSGSLHCLGHVIRGDDTWPQSTGALLQPADVRTCVASLHFARLCKHEHRITLLYAQLKELNPFWLESYKLYQYKCVISMDTFVPSVRLL